MSSVRTDPGERNISSETPLLTHFEQLAQSHLDGTATDAEITDLQASPKEWVEALWGLLDLADRALEHARHKERGPGRANVLNDLDAECYRIDDQLTALIGPATPADLGGPPPKEGVAQLQLSWNNGTIVAWAGGHDADFASEEVVRRQLGEVGAGSINWTSGDALKVGTLGKADTVNAPVMSVMGWLVAQARPTNDPALGASVRWMGLIAGLAVGLVAQGRFVPQLKQSRRPDQSRRRGGKQDSGPKGDASFEVRWLPAAVDEDLFSGLVSSTPNAAMVGQRRQDALGFANAVLADLVHTIVETSSANIEVPAPPPKVHNRNDMGEAVLGHLHGVPFEAPSDVGAEVVRRMAQWSGPLVGTLPVRLIVELKAPDESNAWLASVLMPAKNGGAEPVEVALGLASKTQRKVIEQQVARLERMFAPLLRPGGRRRGEVYLSQDEAWQLMTEIGPRLRTAGFDVRVPPLSRKKPATSLRLTSFESEDSVVGAQQLANVKWSAMFDDVELTAQDITRLAAEARPLVQSRGSWIELDQVDLAKAAAALAERDNMKKMSGADMLRHALGLEGTPFEGGIDLSGVGWAADLLRGIDDLPDDPETTPEGFEGELRGYQADALSWLNFLQDVGLGGCLALDMGLGKTPTTLASLAASTHHGPGLVVAPPAVVGNWASEASRFVPDLKVHVHHGANRAKDADLSKPFGDAELIITTYGTAIRDMDKLAKISWGKVVIDEAQAIKNPAAETSQQLRRLDARTRVALTGTPIENGLGDLWSIMDWANPGLVGSRPAFISQLTPDSKSRGSKAGEEALKALNGILVYRRTKAEPEIAEELPDRIDELDHCAMTTEQIGLYQAVVDSLVAETEKADVGTPARKGAVLAAITALKQICNHPVNYEEDDGELDGRSGKLARLNEIMESVFASDEKMLIFTHFATWGTRLADYLSEQTGTDVNCYHGGLSRTARDKMVDDFQSADGAGALVLSLKAGGTGLNLTAANHVVLYDRWWNPAVEDQARDRVWRIGQTKTVVCHRLVCPGTVDERVEEIVAGKRQIANMVLPKSSSVGDLDAEQLQQALGINSELLLASESIEPVVVETIETAPKAVEVSA